MHTPHAGPPTGLVVTSVIAVYLWLLFDSPRFQGRVGTVILCTFLEPLARLHPVT